MRLVGCCARERFGFTCVVREVLSRDIALLKSM